MRLDELDANEAARKARQQNRNWYARGGPAFRILVALYARAENIHSIGVLVTVGRVQIRASKSLASP
jgi:hypothetical protein